ncbi:MAG: RidA family protein [Planctomycetota bacterium]
MPRIEKRAEALGVELPSAPAALGKYLPAKQVNNLVYTSGQLPLADGTLLHEGRLGEDVSVEEGREAARRCALNCLAAAKAVVDDLDRVEEVVQVRGYVNSAPGFHQQSQVLNGASELLVDLFGEGGHHTRVALGMAALPRNAPIEVDILLRVQ